MCAPSKRQKWSVGSGKTSNAEIFLEQTSWLHLGKALLKLTEEKHVYEGGISICTNYHTPSGVCEESSEENVEEWSAQDAGEVEERSDGDGAEDTSHVESEFYKAEELEDKAEEKEEGVEEVGSVKEEVHCTFSSFLLCLKSKIIEM